MIGCGIDPHTHNPRLAVAIADDSPAMREGLARLISDECDLKAVASAATAAELRTLVTHRPPQVLVMELMLEEGDGLALLKDVLTLAPATRVVVFTMQADAVYAGRCLRAGASAFVNKREPVGTLLRSIREAANGRIMVPPMIAAELLDGSSPARSAKDDATTRLTDRELQVFRLAGLGRPTRVIAGQLGVSVKTVESHRENIKNKLNLATHAELVARAAQWLRKTGGV
jgi:DNA-binding NarL/FixJ family response regulator